MNSFRRRGWSVFLISPPGISLDSELDEVDHQGHQKAFWDFISDRSPQLFFEFLEVISNFYSFYRFEKTIKKCPVDLVYERYSLFNWVATWIARKHKIPIVLEVNDATVITRSRPLVCRRTAVWIEHWVFENATYLVTVSETFKCLIIQNHGIDGSRIRVLPNAVDMIRFPAQPNSGIDRASTDLTVGMVGAFVGWHGAEFFIRSAADFLKSTRTRVVLVGDGPVRGHLEKLLHQMGLEQLVKITGFVPPLAVPRYLQEMDICIMANSNEHGSPMKIFEYMASGKPVLAPAYEPIKEIITHNVNGWLFKPLDSESLLEGLRILHCDSALRKRLGIAARNSIISSHSWDHRTGDIERWIGL